MRYSPLDAVMFTMIVLVAALLYIPDIGVVRSLWPDRDVLLALALAFVWLYRWPISGWLQRVRDTIRAWWFGRHEVQGYDL